MARIKVTEEALSKAIYEGVAEAIIPDNQEHTETNEMLDNMISEYESAGEKFIRVGEHLSQNILPEIKELYAEGIEIVKKVFGDGANLSGMQCSYWGDQFTAKIPVTSLDGYKSYLENEKYYLNNTLKEFASEYTHFEGELNSENYEQMKQAFFSNQEWLVSSIDEALDGAEGEISATYSTLNLSFYKNEVWIEIEFPYDIEKYARFINGDED